MTLEKISSVIADISDHADAHYSAVQGIPAAQAAPGQSGFCTVFNAARPILVAAAGVLFFIPKARGILQALIAGLDAYCSQSAPGAMVAEPAKDAPSAQVLN